MRLPVLGMTPSRLLQSAPTDALLEDLGDSTKLVGLPLTSSLPECRIADRGVCLSALGREVWDFRQLSRARRLASEQSCPCDRRSGGGVRWPGVADTPKRLRKVPENGRSST
jgi:hypothetical protein